MSETADIDLSSDQAAGLRRLFGTRAPQVVAFASGRESCGRTTLVVQTAAALAAAGHAVVIIDENPPPNNAIEAFGLTARYDLMHMIDGERSLRQVALPAAPLVRVIPAARAARELDPLDPAACQRLAQCLQEVQRGAAFVLIDCATRRGGHLSALAQAARHLAVVVAAHGSAITHAYALIKHMAQERGRDGFQMVITRARAREEARAIFDNMKRVAREHLGVRLVFLGASMVPVTEHLAEALTTRLPPSIGEAESGGFVFSPPPPKLERIVMV
ncbi:MAG: MinD/ParA family protein [Rhodocyclaceae bacterium]|nr:MinD/ParA family protein [Rhodocyclaceae bacterium]